MKLDHSHKLVYEIELKDPLEPERSVPVEVKVILHKRVIEISHWSNIVIKETIDFLHTGALLKGLQ